MKTFLIKAWNFINGKKTVIGLALVEFSPKAAEYLTPLLANWGITAPIIIPKIVFTFVWVGKGIGFIGIAHKMLKAKLQNDGSIPVPEAKAPETAPDAPKV